MGKAKTKGYRFYACYKNSQNGGLICAGRDTAYEARVDLMKVINSYITNDVVFVGIIKCSDGNPFNHIGDLV